MCILLYVKVIWCSSILIDVWSIGGGGALVYVHSAICETYSMVVVVYHRSMVNWQEGMHLSLVYVHSDICETYMV